MCVGWNVIVGRFIALLVFVLYSSVRVGTRACLSCLGRGGPKRNIIAMRRDGTVSRLIGKGRIPARAGRIGPRSSGAGAAPRPRGGPASARRGRIAPTTRRGRAPSSRGRAPSSLGGTRPRRRATGRGRRKGGTRGTRARRRRARVPMISVHGGMVHEDCGIAKCEMRVFTKKGSHGSQLGTRRANGGVGVGFPSRPMCIRFCSPE